MASIARVAIVTGAAQGIGASIARRLAKDGLNVAVNDIAAKQESIESLVSEIRGLGREAISIPGDVGSEKDVRDIVASTAARLGGLDVMISNAGIFTHGFLTDATTADWDRTMRVNARGQFLCHKYAAIQMIAQGRGGNIVGISSVAGKRGIANYMSYCMSKFAIRGLTQTASLELRKHNIRVNSIAPGAIRTSMFDEALKEQPVDHPAVDKFTSEVAATGPEAVASMASYLIKPEAYFIHGQTICVDGGIHFD